MHAHRNTHEGANTHSTNLAKPHDFYSSFNLIYLLTLYDNLVHPKVPYSLALRVEHQKPGRLQLEWHGSERCSGTRTGEKIRKTPSNRNGQMVHFKNVPSNL